MRDIGCLFRATTENTAAIGCLCHRQQREGYAPQCLFGDIHSKYINARVDPDSLDGVGHQLDENHFLKIIELDKYQLTETPNL